MNSVDETLNCILPPGTFLKHVDILSMQTHYSGVL